MNDILINKSTSVQRQSSIKSSLLSAANNDLVSLSFEGEEFTKLVLRLVSYDVFRQI
jgi:hypothetical protein